MANYLASKGVKIAFVVTFDPLSPNLRARRGIDYIVNYYLSMGPGKSIGKAGGFQGRMRNIIADNIKDVDHFNIEKISKYHNQIFDIIEKITKKINFDLLR